MSRGVNLCLAELYAVDTQIKAESIALQALSSKVLFSGKFGGRPTASLAKSRYGLLLSSSSLARLNFAEVSSANPIVMRGAKLWAISVAFKPNDLGLNEGSGMMLERNSTAQLLTSTISGFRCATSFADAGSRVELKLPGNDVIADNTHRACGPGQFSLIE